jgi:hypothetical protein
MHARRDFVKALEAGDTRAAVPVAAFQALYAVEQTVHDADAATRKAERQRRSKPVYDELVCWCELHRPMEPPSSLLGRAVGYLLNHRLALMRCWTTGSSPSITGSWSASIAGLRAATSQA